MATTARIAHRGTPVKCDQVGGAEHAAPLNRVHSLPVPLPFPVRGLPPLAVLDPEPAAFVFRRSDPLRSNLKSCGHSKSPIVNRPVAGYGYDTLSIRRG